MMLGLGQVCVEQAIDYETNLPYCVQWSEPIGPHPAGDGTFGVPVYGTTTTVVCRTGVLGDKLCSTAEIKRGISDQYLMWILLAAAGVGVLMMVRR